MKLLINSKNENVTGLVLNLKTGKLYRTYKKNTVKRSNNLEIGQYQLTIFNKEVREKRINNKELKSLKNKVKNIKIVKQKLDNKFIID